MEVCDVTILPLRVAKYYVNSKFPDSLLSSRESCSIPSPSVPRLRSPPRIPYCGTFWTR